MRWREEIVIHLASILESLLFAFGEPVSQKEIKAVLTRQGVSFSEEEWEAAIQKLHQRYDESISGLELIRMNEYIQLGTKRENYESLREFLHPIKKKSLTQAALETLSIIAYKQPVTKAEIESIRGVRSDKAIHTLVEAGLVCENGRVEKIGRPILYGTTREFLRYFSLTSLKDLPSFSIFEQELSESAEEKEVETMDKSNGR